MTSKNREGRPRRLLVLGAGRDQCFMLRCAQEMGIETLAVDGDPQAPGLALADRFAVVSNRDVPAILASVARMNVLVDGVSTMGSDIPHVVAEVAGHLGVPSISKNAAAVAVDKFRMKECFSAAGIDVPEYRRVSSLDDLLPLLGEWGRVVLKPLQQAGSRGVSLVGEKRGLAPALAQALRFSQDGTILAERFVPGDQISSESLIVDGRVYTPGLADRNYDELARFLPQIIENGGWVPSRYQSDRPEIDRVIEACARALGVRDGVIKGDLVRRKDGCIAVIEVAARLSGGDFSESLVPLATGVNYVKQVIRQAVGLPVEIASLESTRSQCVANRYFFAPPGRLISVEGVGSIRSKPWIEKLEVGFDIGDTIPVLEGHGQRAGVFVVSGPDRATVARRIEEVYATVEFKVEQTSRRAAPGEANSRGPLAAAGHAA